MIPVARVHKSQGSQCFSLCWQTGTTKICAVVEWVDTLINARAGQRALTASLHVRFKSSPALQKRYGTTVGKWYSACPEVCRYAGRQRPPQRSGAGGRASHPAIMRRADAEAKAMAIGNIADVLRLKTVSPLQKMCVPLRAGKVCCIQGRGAGGLQHGNF